MITFDHIFRREPSVFIDFASTTSTYEANVLSRGDIGNLTILLVCVLAPLVVAAVIEHGVFSVGLAEESFQG